MKEKLKKRKLNLPPSPAKLPIIGNLHQLGNMPHISLRGLAKKYGPIIFLQLGEIPTVVISSVGLAKEVLKTHDLVISSRPQLFSAKHLFYGCTDSAFAPYGAYRRNVRKICILELLSAKRVHWYSFVREEEVARLIRRIAESSPGITNLSSMIALYANFQVEDSVLGKQEEKKDLVDVLLDIQKDGSSEIPLTMDNIKAVILVSEDDRVSPGFDRVGRVPGRSTGSTGFDRANFQAGFGLHPDRFHARVGRVPGRPAGPVRV
ncbi:hypothetical protein NC653_038344 [Populus alba x Populus x berolinensis]|uniref:Uncharacterized protein n=1 Tax=Populus alba x Populus x berolinensis TaxID=444605 RepID=A0AAD6LGG3_9ROSI|nr:hypothetical protein NC653_038344 [Populus alba x Populus x berolinensis]